MLVPVHPLKGKCPMRRSLRYQHVLTSAMCWWAGRRCHLRLRRALRSVCRIRTCTMLTGQRRPLWMPQVQHHCVCFDFVMSPSCQPLKLGVAQGMT